MKSMHYWLNVAQGRPIYTVRRAQDRNRGFLNSWHQGYVAGGIALYSGLHLFIK